MLAILATHPIQYQVPLWQMLARDGTVPFEVWYLSRHATNESRDREFGKDFAWDIDMLEGYPHRFLKTPAGSTPNTPLRSRVAEPLPDLFQQTQAKILWVQGWQVAAYWQAVRAAKRAGLQVWLRGESNALREQGERSPDTGQRSEGIMPALGLRMFTPQGARRAVKRALLGRLFRQVDQFLCIGTANRELYRSYGVPENKLHLTPYAVDNDRFRQQAETARRHRSQVRSQWKIPENAFCALFCGKFIAKKRPMDLIAAVTRLRSAEQGAGSTGQWENSSSSSLQAPGSQLHLLFVGSGELGPEMRANCNVVFDAENPQLTPDARPVTPGTRPSASFAGFLNQTEVSQAYVAADVLVLPSDYGETWGLVVNEAMASGLPCIISDHCGCAPDLGSALGNTTYQCGEIRDLAQKIAGGAKDSPARPATPPAMTQTISVVTHLLAKSVVV